MKRYRYFELDLLLRYPPDCASDYLKSIAGKLSLLLFVGCLEC